LATLIDGKQVDLDAPIRNYVDGLPDHIQPLTARMLASHTAGVRHYSRIPTYWLGWHESNSSRAYANVADGLEMFIHDDLRFEPGTNFAYSTFGYSLLSRLLEGATGKDFKTLLSERLFEPAGMTDTAVDLAGEMPARVSFYTTASGNYLAAYPTDASYKIAGGGIVSTPADLVRLGMALLGDKLVSETTRTVLWTPVKLPDGSTNPENYGLGWRIDAAKGFPDAQDETLLCHHGGVQEGGVCFFVIAPAYGIAAAAVANTGEAAARTEVQNLAVTLIRLAAKRPSR
jgi:CubicO group peptidase (beta-lactamase class C family)